jgi:hypothetical protein
MMVKEAGIHEGRWFLLLTFGLGAGNFARTPDDRVNPGVVAAVTSIGSQREDPNAKMPPSMVVDAAEVNPAPRARSSTRRSGRRTKS